MEEKVEAQVDLKVLANHHKEAQLAHDVLCALLTAMVAHYRSDGVLDEHLTKLAEELMSQVWNRLSSMDYVLKGEKIPF